MELCDEVGCSVQSFGGHKCKYHQFRRYMRGGDKYKPKQGQKTTIPKESKKRIVQKRSYKEVKDELRKELKAEGKWNCFFCTKPMGDEKGFHHLKGRDGQNYIDKKWLVPGHNDCHVWKYHHARVEDLINEVWYPEFLVRLKSKEPQLYYKELKKQEKIELNLDFE